MPAWLPPVVETLTVWLATSDSWPSLNRRYCSRFMRRSDIGSRPTVVLGWGMQSRKKLQRLKLEVSVVRLKLGVCEAGVPKGELAGVLPSPRNFHILNALP